MRLLSNSVLAGVLALVACHHPPATAPITDPLMPNTGLAGMVRRAPTTPVCQVEIPCDAPFAAHFSVFAGGQAVASFRSDSAGRFQVALPPGTFVIVPGPDAPIISPASQTRQVTVDSAGVTWIGLEFDTGIR